MKKSTKLLSVILAIVMIFSSLSVMASAYQAYDDGQQAVYDSNDKGLAFLLTDEQRASWFCDLVNDLLLSVNIKQEVAVIGTIDLTSLDAVCDTIGNLKGLIGVGGAFVDLGLLEKLNFGAINKDISVNNTNGAQEMITALLNFLDTNIGTVIDTIIPGGISLGIINVGDLSAVNDILADIDGFIEEMVYGLGARKITNGIGNDPEWPNSPEWTSEAMPLDTIVQNILVKVLTEPNHTRKATVPADNEILTNPEAFGATAAMIHTETADDGSGDTWYYIYGTQNSAGEWEFTEASTKLDGVSDKNYILTWDENSGLVKDFDTSVLEFTSKPLYQMLGEVLPWAYETFGATNLDGQLRATLMQFAGARNVTFEDDAVKATLEAKMEAKKAVQDNSTKAALGDAFEAETGAAGNYNFAYFSLSGADINTMPDDLYYVVEWDGNWEFYKVDFTEVVDEKLAMFSAINWEYQTPGTYAELMPAGFNSATDSSLRNITDAIGKIAATAVKDLAWTYDSASEDNAHFEDNAMGLVKRFLKLAPNLILGADDAYKVENIDSMTNEQVLVLIGADVMNWLMPSIVLPADVSCLEELVVYGVREFIAEIMPEYSWDDKIAAASTDAEYLDIVLDMGLSIGVYYLREVIALGTVTDGNGNTSTIDVPIGPEHTWEEMLNFIVDQILTIWVPDLMLDVKADNATAFASSDGLLKLTAIFNSLFPGLLSLISGCEGNGYAVDLAVVKDLIAGILDCEIEPIAAKLYRNTTGYANKALYPAVVSIVKDLLNGLGASNSNDYANLIAPIDTALAATYPLDTLIQDAQLKPLIKNLVWTLADADTANVPATVRSIWLYNFLAILMQVTGQMDDMNLEGIAQTLDQIKYIGTTTPSITPSVTLNTKGLKSVWYDQGYRNGNFVRDGEYTAVLTKYEICDLQGNVVATKDVNATLTPNSTYSGTSITGVAGDTTKAYTLKSYVVVTLPDGVTKANNGEPIVTVSNFMTAAAANDDSVNPVTVLNNKTNVTVKMWNIYLDENTPLAEIANYQMNVSTTSDKARKLYINGYGYLTDNGDGSYTFQADKADAFTWAYKTSNGDDLTLAPGDSRTVFYWRWNNVYADTEFGNNKDWATMDTQQWYVDTKNFTRDHYPADFTTFAFNSTNYSVYWYKNLFSKGTDTHTGDATPYIIFFNSYGLEGKIQSALNANRIAADYTAETWSEYLSALEAAIAEFYMPRTAATFMDVHTTNGVSDFKTAAERLDVAVEGLEKAVESADTGTASSDYTVEEKAVLANLKTTLDAQAEKKELNNKNYIMYRWLKYYNENAWLWNIYNSSVIPSGVAQDKLEGVPSDNAEIAKVIAAAPTAKQAAITAMKVAPTAEETAAAQKAKADFTDNLPVIDTTAIQVDMAQMAQYEARLIKDTPYTQYLVSAYNMVKDINNASDYTAESWAKFVEARMNAYNVAAESTSTPAAIHEARYDLLVAYKALTKAGTDVDLTALREKMAFVETIFVNPDLFQPSAAAIEAGYDTLDKAMAEVLKEAGVKVTVGDTTYYVGGGDTGAAWLDEAGFRTAKEAQVTVDRVTNEIAEALAYVESSIKMVPDETVAGNTTEVGGNYIVDGLKPGTINSAAELLDLVTTAAPSGYTASLAVTASAAAGFGTGTKVVMTIAEVPSLVFTHTVMVYGDVNGDGAIDAFDAALIDQHIAGTQLTGDFAAAADASADTVISVADYAAVANHAIGAGTISQTRA